MTMSRSDNDDWDKESSRFVPRTKKLRPDISEPDPALDSLYCHSCIESLCSSLVFRVSQKFLSAIAIVDVLFDPLPRDYNCTRDCLLGA